MVPRAEVTGAREPGEAPPPVLQRVVRVVLVAVILAAGLSFFARYLQAMATSSLWADEIWSATRYAGEGPLTVLTRYDEPNNHVFFNLLNSLPPGRGSVAPLRARMWSMAAAAALLAWLLASFHRRRAFAWGLLPFLLFAAGPEFLDLTLQARGYGILALFALAASTAAAEHVRTGRTRALVLLAGASLLGIWTVPTFAFFVGPLWLLLWAAVRGVRVPVAAAAAAACSIAVYLPILRNLLRQLSHFGAEWGREYGTLGAVKVTVVQYLLHPLVVGRTLDRLALVVLAAGLGAVVALAWREEPVEGRAAAVVLGASALFLAICLALQTPVIRSTAFVVVPIAFGGTLAAAAASRGVPVRFGRWAALAGLSLLALRGIAVSRSFSFRPMEAWMEMSALLSETFPDGTPFFVSHEAQYLELYLPRRNARVRDFDRSSFAKGEELYLDTPIVDPPGGRVDGGAFAPCAVEFRLAQRRVAYEGLWLCPPPTSHVAAIRAGGSDLGPVLIDRDPATGTADRGESPRDREVVVQLVPGRRYRSLLVVARDVDPPRLSVEARAPDGAEVPVGRIRTSVRMTLVALGDREVSRLILRAEGGGPVPPLQEVWANPSRRDP